MLAYPISLSVHILVNPKINSYVFFVHGTKKSFMSDSHIIFKFIVLGFKIKIISQS